MEKKDVEMGEKPLELVFSPFRILTPPFPFQVSML
jgi:hypothetical protein